jgi:hypothetical protein
MRRVFLHPLQGSEKATVFPGHAPGAGPGLGVGPGLIVSGFTLPIDKVEALEDLRT